MYKIKGLNLVSVETALKHKYRLTNTHAHAHALTHTHTLTPYIATHMQLSSGKDSQDQSMVK